MAIRAEASGKDRVGKQVLLRYSTQTSEIPSERGKLLVVARLTCSPVLGTTAGDGELDWALFGGVQGRIPLTVLGGFTLVTI